MGYKQNKIPFVACGNLFQFKSWLELSRTCQMWAYVEYF